MSKQYDDGVRQFEDGYNSFRDSINLEFAEYLAKTWELFKVEPPVELPPKPKPPKMPPFISVDTIYLENLLIEEQEPVNTLHVDAVSTVSNNDINTSALSVNFFGTPITFNTVKILDTKLTGTDEEQVSNYWKQLLVTDYRPFIDDLVRQKTSMELDPWGFYQLLLASANAGFPKHLENEKTIFIAYILNTAGYKAILARESNTLLILLAIKNPIFGKYSVKYNDGIYYVVNNRDKVSKNVYSYQMNYKRNTVPFELKIQSLLKLRENAQAVKRTFKNKEYTFQYNKNLTDYYNTYPQTELKFYINAPFSKKKKKSLIRELTSELKDKTVTEKLKFLLALVQKGFKYRTDEEQFGREKFFFAEETLQYPYSDCEDRALFFCRLVKLFCGLDTLLLDYPKHVAAAVKSDEPGAAITFNNNRYIICDPSFIDAPIARIHDDYTHLKPKIIIVQ